MISRNILFTLKNDFFLKIVSKNIFLNLGHFYGINY